MGGNHEYDLTVDNIFRYPGGKNKRAAKEFLVRHLPNTFSEYREAFCGSAALFLSVPTAVRRWVNDRDENLVAVFLALRDRPAAFMAKCREVEPPTPDEPLVAINPGGRPIHNARLKAVFDRCVADRFAEDDLVERAFRWFFINRTVWGGRVNYHLPSRLYFSNPTGWNVTKTAALEGVAEKMAGVRVTAEDYTAVLREPGENVVIYCDPPYLVNSGLSKTSQLYAHNFTLADHERFAAEVRACRHKVVVSYDDDEGGVIRSLFRGFNFHTAEWTYCGTSSAKAANGPQTKKVGKELIITNYGEIV